MSLERAKEHLSEYGRDHDVLEFDVSSATVELAAKAIGCAPERIAKTLSFGSSNSAIELTPDELEKLTPGSTWVDVCKLPETD